MLHYQDWCAERTTKVGFHRTLSLPRQLHTRHDQRASKRTVYDAQGERPWQLCVSHRQEAAQLSVFITKDGDKQPRNPKEAKQFIQFFRHFLTLDRLAIPDLLFQARPFCSNFLGQSPCHGFRQPHWGGAPSTKPAADMDW